MTEPERTLFRTRLMIAAVPGSDQSLGSRVHRMIVLPSAAARE